MIHYPDSDILSESDSHFLKGCIIMDKFKDFGVTLTKLRKRKHIKQSELAALLADRGISVTNQAISKWETGKTVPNAIQFLIICDIYGVEDVMSCFSNDQEEKLSRRKTAGREEMFSGLNENGRKMVTELIQVLSESDRYAQRE